MILPDSLIRTYNLLKIIRPEYEHHFISGAMLFYEEMNFLYEDVGFMDHEGTYGPLKDRVDTRKIEYVLRCEEMIHEPKNAYAGWWYCCIRMEFVRKDNLPLPVFVRGDDVEYSLKKQGEVYYTQWYLYLAYGIHQQVQRRNGILSGEKTP